MKFEDGHRLCDILTVHLHQNTKIRKVNSANVQVTGDWWSTIELHMKMSNASLSASCRTKLVFYSYLIHAKSTWVAKMLKAQGQKRCSSLLCSDSCMAWWAGSLSPLPPAEQVGGRAQQALRLKRTKASNLWVICLNWPWWITFAIRSLLEAWGSSRIYPRVNK